MNKYYNHIDYSQQNDDTYTYRNNHNSNLIQHNELNKPINKINFRKKQTIIPYKNSYQSQLLLSSSSIILILIRLIILIIICCLFYYIFIYFYPKSKQNRWERLWYTIIHWFIE